MAVLTTQDIGKLRRVIAIVEKLITKSKTAKPGRPSNGRAARSTNGGKRIRRTGNELVAFRKTIKAERRKGVSVDALARKHGVSAAYIYMIR